MFRTLVTSVVFVAAANFAPGQDPVSSPGAQNNGPVRPGCSAPATKPALYGRPYAVPALPLRVVTASTGEPLAGATVRARYTWKWLEYPYPEHPEGSWNDACDVVEWPVDRGGLSVLPEYEVNPRGWNLPPPKSIFTAFRHPEPYFDGIEFEVSKPAPGNNYYYAFKFTRKEVEKIKRSGVIEIMVKVAQTKIRRGDEPGIGSGGGVVIRYGKR